MRAIVSPKNRRKCFAYAVYVSTVSSSCVVSRLASHCEKCSSSGRCGLIRGPALGFAVSSRA
jgi:hypothetical protein